MLPKSRIGFLALIGLIAPVCAGAQPAPQTARQALIEMFFGKTPGSLEKHLPDAFREALGKATAGQSNSTLATFALLASQLQANGQELQTFEAGPVLLSFENPRQNSKFEIVIENDDLRADEDDIEVSFRGYKDGQAQFTSLSPRLVFGMKQEKSVWRLNEITTTFKISLTDPEILKAISDWKPPANTYSAVSISPSSGMHGANEAFAISGVRSILRAETTYANTYGHGYTCSLTDLGGMGGTERNDHQAMLIDPRLASGKKNGYVFAFSGCSGSSTIKFTLNAIPAEGGGKAFCADESGAVRFSADGSAVSCLSTGRPVQ